MHSEIVHDWTPYNRWVDKVSESRQIRGAANNSHGLVDDCEGGRSLRARRGCAVAIVLWAWRDPKSSCPRSKSMCGSRTSWLRRRRQ